jgi:YD repeat-containing protein
VSDGADSAAYSYLANSALVDHIVFAHNGNAVMTNQNTYDKLNRLTGISSVSSVSSVVNFQYQYNLAGQRTRVTLLDGSYWTHGYDALGQLTNSVKYFWDGTPYAGQQFVNGYDTIGNRLSAQAGGDASGANLRQASYTNNALNQITSRDVPGYVDVMGLTLSTNTVKVNGTKAYQKSEYFREQIGTNNTSAPQWVGVNVTAPGQSNVSGGAYLAQTPETNSYDADGNLTSDGRWTYTWDAENRLIAMTSLPNAPLASQYSLSFAYDYMGRRIQKIVSTNSASGYVPQYTNLYVYDGWNLIGVLTPQSSVIASMMWGTDLSGSMQGAGGVGGLVAENLAGNGVQFVCYDGAGNVSALVSATNGAVTAT